MIMSSVARVKFIKTKSFLVIIPKVSQIFGPRNQKLFMFKFEKRKSGKNFLDYKSGQEGLQIRAALGI